MTDDDCYHRALPGEPKWTFLGRDSDAPAALRKWANKREQAVARGDRPPEDMEDVRAARAKAYDMVQWRVAHDGIWRQPDILKYHAETGQFETGVFPQEPAQTGRFSGGTVTNANEPRNLGLGDTPPPSPILQEPVNRQADMALGRHVITACKAVRQSDEMFCRECHLRWGVDDHDPPQCPRALTG